MNPFDDQPSERCPLCGAGVAVASRLFGRQFKCGTIHTIQGNNHERLPIPSNRCLLETELVNGPMDPDAVFMPEPAKAGQERKWEAGSHSSGYVREGVQIFQGNLVGRYIGTGAYVPYWRGVEHTTFAGIAIHNSDPTEDHQSPLGVRCVGVFGPFPLLPGLGELHQGCIGCEVWPVNDSLLSGLPTGSIEPCGRIFKIDDHRLHHIPLVHIKIDGYAYG